MNNSSNEEVDTESIEYTETIVWIFIDILLICCFIALFVNVLVIVSIHWIRHPMTPVLKISLSLAVADAFSSSLYAAIILGNYPSPYLEMLKLAGIVITVAHLLALSINHYIGILKPLHYNSIVTRRKVTVIIGLLWIVPFLILVLIFTIESDCTIITSIFQPDTNITVSFMNTFRFRFTYSSLLLIPIIVMCVAYSHILFIVRKQKKVWKHLSRVGSTKWRGRSVGECKTNRVQNEQRQMDIKALYTTLMIMGSCFMGWMPAILVFTLMCQSDCYVNGNDLDNLNINYPFYIYSLRLIENMLILMKMMANPVIYSIRMKEIKDGRRRMFLAFNVLFCPSRRERSDYTLACRRSPLQNSSSMQIRITSFKTNNGHNHVSLRHPDPNTFL